MSSLHDKIGAYAAEIGLDAVGITTPEPFDRFLSELSLREEAYRDRYAYRLDTWRRMADPRQVLPDARAVLVLGFHYLPPERPQPRACGKVGRIVAYGHLGILKRARLMAGFLKGLGYKAVMGAHRKEAAVRAGLGIVGRHNLVIHPEFGSWVAYQTLVTDAPLEAGEPCVRDTCGECRACLDACPTGALYEPRRVDPRRCVACLLTSREVPPGQRPALGSYILGCDACQEACPRNRGLKPKPAAESLLPAAIGMYPPLRLLLEMDEAEFQRTVIGPMQRKMTGDGLLARLGTVPAVRAAMTWCVKKFLRGRERLPETFVHASGNLNVYQRNALVAAGNLRCSELRDAAERCRTDETLKPYAEWAMERMNA